MTVQPEENGRDKDPAIVLAERVRSLRGTGGYLTDQLEVDDRVLARITDGIYRRPSSALRELIFNAYDADATKVIIDTDAPRFDRISIRDNGSGMDETVIADLFKHIGGSSKRTYKGVRLHTVNAADPDLSPGGRSLIGKIGIGMFAVSHLTTHFRIITKRKGDAYRLVAEVQLKTWTEENLRKNSADGSPDAKFVTGDVLFSHEAASDTDSHGTEIILLDLRKQSRDILRSRDVWELLQEDAIKAKQEGRKATRQPPEFHIGFATLTEPCSYEVKPCLPWTPESSPSEKFSRLYNGVVAATDTRGKNPDIEEVLDGYLAMIWRLSLAAPLPYLGKHPFDFSEDDQVDVLLLQNRERGQAQQVSLDKGQTVAGMVGLKALTADFCGEFSVVIDGIELKRPVLLESELLGDTKRVRAKSPMLFVGKLISSLGDAPADRSGGPLEFEAYFYWNSLIVPKQNRGILIRIHGASGVLYDDRFMDYQVSELNRLKQITAEVFIIRGMDPALNIDRESFNVSHPHYQYLTKWVHLALKQITNRLKDIGKKGKDEETEQLRTVVLSKIQQHIQKVWDEAGDSIESRPEVVLTASVDTQPDAALRRGGTLVFHVDEATLKEASAATNGSGISIAEQSRAVMAILVAYGLLDEMPYSRQQDLFRDLLEVLILKAK